MNTEERTSGTSGSKLQGKVGLVQFFNLAFGSIMGIAWLVMVGNWLGMAGPLGAIIGFALGACMMLIIGLCYAELVTTLPIAGGEVVYAYEISGPRLAYVIGWYLALIYIAVCTFEAISLAWILQVLIPGIEGPVLYAVLGTELTAGAVAIGLVATVLLAYLNYRGIHAAARFQDVLTYTLLLAAVLFWAASIAGGDLRNAEPLFKMDGDRIAWTGVLWVFVTTPLWFSGFQVIPQVMEERAEGVSLALVGRVILLAIGMAAVFYILVILSSAIVVPWETVLDAELPVAAALDAAFDNPILTKLVLIAGVVGILTTWNAVMMVASRLLLALGRARLLPSHVASIHPRFGSPAVAVLVVAVISALAIFMGRNALIPIVNIGASCFSFAFVVTCWGVIKLRRDKPDLDRPYKVPGGIATARTAMVIASLVLAYSLYEPFASAGYTVPLEWYVLSAWGTARRRVLVRLGENTQFGYS